MNTATSPSFYDENKLVWAIVCSMLLHVTLAFVVPNFKLDNIKKRDLLEIELVDKPEPPPPPKPIDPLPEPPKPKKVEPIKQPPPEPPKVKKVEPAPVVNKPLPTVVRNEPITQPPPTPQPDVIAVAPKPEAAPPPVATVPIAVPEPPKPAAPPQADINAARDSYGGTLWEAISKHKVYPRIAQMRGWQGEVVVELLLDGNGKVKSKKILQHSGYEVLDKQALDMVEKAAPFPLPPEVLRGSSFSITVPIPFRLE